MSEPCCLRGITRTVVGFNWMNGIALVRTERGGLVVKVTKTYGVEGRVLRARCQVVCLTKRI